MSRDLLSELKQKKPFARPEEELFLSLVRTADLLCRTPCELLKKSDLSPAQYNVLRILRGANEAGLTCGEIASRMVTRDPDVTRLLDRMVLRGLVSRIRKTGDRRVVLANITASGLEILKLIEQPMLDIHQSQLASLSPHQIEEMLARLTQIRDGLAPH